MKKIVKQEQSELQNSETKVIEEPVYTNWDFPNFIKNNPNATPEQITKFLKDKKFRDFMIFGK
jgi:hypothetical protein